jgi:ABC-type lipoprotein release transport system permease subunit
MLNTIRVAFFLAVRQLFKNNIRSVTLIVMVMTLTFLSLVAISGILVGLIEGSSKEYRERITGDVVISPLEDKDNIEDTIQIEQFLTDNKNLNFSTRYTQSGIIEGNYTNRKDGKDKDTVGALVVGFTPSKENLVTKFNEMVFEGEPLTDEDRGKVLIGKELLSQYANLNDKDKVLDSVAVGDRVLLEIKGRQYEFTIKGFVKSKAEEVGRRAFISEQDLRTIAGRSDLRAQEIALRKLDSSTDEEVKQLFIDNGFGDNQKVETYQEAEPTFVGQIKTTFAILGNFFGAIGLIVAFITIFIIIYINAITRRKYIGIMKGIGMSPAVIELSYVMQSIFYAIIGSGIGALIVYFGLIPLLNAYPIDFPFSDGIMVAPYKDTFIKFLILFFTTLLAGYIPARNIVKQNTLNSILGR